MKILTLSIKQKFFDEIVAGTKTHEYREIRPTNAKKYIRYICNGKEYAEDELPEEGEVDILPVEYDAIKFLTGAYSGKRPYIVVKVEFSQIVILTDENDERIVYECNGKEYCLAEMDYTLGEIIERSAY